MQKKADLIVRQGAALVGIDGVEKIVDLEGTIEGPLSAVSKKIRAVSWIVHNFITSRRDRSDRAM